MTTTFVFQIFIFPLLMLAAGFIWGYSLKQRKVHPFLFSKEEIIECFRDVDWTKHTFTVNGNISIKSPNGDTQFYSVREVKKATDRIDKLIERAD